MDTIGRTRRRERVADADTRLPSTVDQRTRAPLVFAVGLSAFAGFIVAHELAADGSVAERLLVSVVAVAAATGLTSLFGRSTRSVQSALAIGVGAISTASAIGMRAYAIPKEGLSWIDAITIPTLATGLALLGLGTALALRHVRGWRRIVGLPAGLLLVYYVIWPVTIALMVTHVPEIEVGSKTPADYGLAYEDAWFETRDGATLSGWYLPSENGAAVALIHGSGSTRSNVLEHAAFLNRNGYGTLLFDSRGFGRSEGVGMSTGWYGDLDIDAAVTYLSERPDVEPGRIGVLGLSMGGEEAIAAAATDDRIRAVVAEGAGAVRSVDDMAAISEVGRVLGFPHYWLQTAVTDAFTDAPRPIGLVDAMAAIAPRPVMLISAGETELEYTEAYQAAAPHTTELWAPPDSGHTRALYTHQAEYRERVLRLFAEALGRA